MKLDDILKTKVGRLAINAHLHALGAVQNQKPKPDPVPALDSKPPRKPGCKRRVDLVVTIVSLRHKLLDDDNLSAGAKSLRDSVAASLGVDDADRRVKWEYGQLETKGEEGTIVQISVCKSHS